MELKIIVLAFFLIIVQSCNQSTDLEAEKQAILVLHEEQRKAHFEKDAALLMSQASPEFTVVNRGAIDKPTKEESIQKFQAYFDAVDFVKWDDVTPPVFSFSEDGTMATTIVDKLVITRQKQEGNQLDTTHFAWLTVYKKRNGKWEMESMASTNK